jgi:hypothetical protein
MRKNNNRNSIRFITIFYCRILTIIFFACCCSYANKSLAQLATTNGAKIFHFTSANTCFPETKRLNGYTYDSQFLDYSTHYRDSSVLMVVPDKFNVKNNSVDIVFWFHGWHNNIDTALNYYHLASQFIASNKNAVLVLAEAAKNAPDSYGGKLEQQDVFKNLLKDVLLNLQKNKIISSSCKAGNIILAGHSGAYRVIAYILQNGGVVVHEVDLFDALYSETDKFLQWIKKDSANKFINFYTNTGGGTDEVSLQMMDELKKEKIPFLFTEETDMNASLLRNDKIIFIHSKREHNDIIFSPDNFRLFLERSPFLTSFVH